MADDSRDDPSIPSSDRLFRRVRSNQLFTEPDGSRRPNSAVFKNTELSVNIESLMIEQGRPPEDTLTKFSTDYLTSITAGNVRSGTVVTSPCKHRANVTAVGIASRCQNAAQACCGFKHL